MRTRRSTRKRPRPSMTDTSDDDHSRSATRSGSTIPASNSSLESCAPDGMVPIWFWNCSTAEQYSSLILRPVDNSSRTWPRLNPYLTSEPPAPADKVNLHLPEHSRTWGYHPRPISSLDFILFSLAEDVKLSALGRHLKIILPFSFMFFISVSF